MRYLFIESKKMGDMEEHYVDEKSNINTKSLDGDYVIINITTPLTRRVVTECQTKWRVCCTCMSGKENYNDCYVTSNIVIILVILVIVCGLGGGIIAIILKN